MDDIIKGTTTIVLGGPHVISESTSSPWVLCKLKNTVKNKC